MTKEIVQVSVDDIRISTTNPRKNFDIDDLVASIRQGGVKVPIAVRPIEDAAFSYELVAGERRLRSVQRIFGGQGILPCIVREMTDQEAIEFQIVENLQRADVHPAEEADAYQAMFNGGTIVTVADVAKAVGKTESYVATRLRLRTLELDAKLLFIKGHMTLGHALELARLEPADQIRALEFMMEIDRRYNKQPLTAIIADGLKDRKAAQSDPVQYGSRVNDDRIIKASEAQLKTWIKGHVLLQLKGAPWRLDDPNLVPAAGACTTCPKRSGSNVALFGELTSAEDVCTDTVCFAAKQDATVKAHKAAAKQAAVAEGVKSGGGLLMKISDKKSEMLLEEIAVDNGVCTTRKAVKRGQWILAGKKLCSNTVKALVVDGPDKGKMLEVCADQKCKTHAHRVASQSDTSRHVTTAKPEDPAVAAKRIAALQAEKVARLQIYEEINARVGRADLVQPALLTIREAIREVKAYGQCEWEIICAAMNIPLSAAKAAEVDAEDVFMKVMETAGLNTLLHGLFHVLHSHKAAVEPWQMSNAKHYRKPLEELAAAYGVKPAKAKAVPNKAPKPVAKKKAKK